MYEKSDVLHRSLWIIIDTSIVLTGSSLLDLFYQISWLYLGLITMCWSFGFVLSIGFFLSGVSVSAFSATSFSALPTPLDVTNTQCTAISFHKTSGPQDQTDLIARITKDDVKDLICKAPGFVSLSCHKSIDGEKCACYWQWETQEDWDRYCQEFNLFPMDFEHKFEIFATATVDGKQASIKSPDQAPFVHFAEFHMHAVDLQPRMMELAKDALVQAMQDTPGLLSATFHASTDGAMVVNYGQWENMQAIENLKKKPGFSSAAPYWDGLANNEHHLYELVTTLHG